MNISNMKVVSNETYESIIFEDEEVMFTDIDVLFAIANRNFARLLIDMGLDVTFDFISTYNKKLYTHSFLQTTCDYINELYSSYKVAFYSNNLTKDPFKLRLIKKLRRIFGFKILEDVLSFPTVIFKLESNSCEWTPRVDVFLMSDTKPKTFKHIKNYLHKTGLTYLQDVYFQQVANKLSLIG